MNDQENNNNSTQLKFDTKIPRSMSYVLSGNPIPWARARITKDRHFYDAQAHLKVITGLQISHQHAGQPLFAGPLVLEITFFMAVPHKAPARNKLKLYGLPHKNRPDLDNLCKYPLDVATKICYNDDAQISVIISRKIYDRNPRTEFTIRELL